MASPEKEECEVLLVSEMTTPARISLVLWSLRLKFSIWILEESQNQVSVVLFSYDFGVLLQSELLSYFFFTFSFLPSFLYAMTRNNRKKTNSLAASSFPAEQSPVLALPAMDSPPNLLFSDFTTALSSAMEKGSSAAANFDSLPMNLQLLNAVANVQVSAHVSSNLQHLDMNIPLNATLIPAPFAATNDMKIAAPSPLQNSEFEEEDDDENEGNMMPRKKFGPEAKETAQSQMEAALRAEFSCRYERIFDTPTSRLRKFKRSASFNSRRVVLLFSVISFA